LRARSSVGWSDRPRADDAVLAFLDARAIVAGAIVESLPLSVTPHAGDADAGALAVGALAVGALAAGVAAVAFTRRASLRCPNHETDDNRDESGNCEDEE
jgi:hypothetical protein